MSTTPAELGVQTYGGPVSMHGKASPLGEQEDSYSDSKSSDGSSSDLSGEDMIPFQQRGAQNNPNTLPTKLYLTGFDALSVSSEQSAGHTGDR